MVCSLLLLATRSQLSAKPGMGGIPMPWGRIDGMASSRRMSRIRYPTTRWRRQQNHLQLSAVPMTIVGTEPRKRPYLYTSTGRCRRRDISLLRVGNTVHEVHYRQGMMNCDKPALPQRIVQDPIYNAMCFGARPMSDSVAFYTGLSPCIRKLCSPS